MLGRSTGRTFGTEYCQTASVGGQLVTTITNMHVISVPSALAYVRVRLAPRCTAVGQLCVELSGMCTCKANFTV